MGTKIWQKKTMGSIDFFTLLYVDRKSKKSSFVYTDTLILLSQESSLSESASLAQLAERQSHKYACDI